MKVQISAVIITFNEERNIARCIDSLKDIADEILVLDSFSTDRTKAICTEKKVRFMEHAFDGYIEQKNRASNLALHPYILSLDADEALSPALAESILKTRENWKCDAYTMNRLTNYCGTWIHHCSWYPDTKLRLFDKRKGAWGGVNPHDKFEMQPGATTCFLNGDILHYSYYDVEQHYRQADKFSTISANILYEKGKRASLLQLIISPAIKFIRDYFINLGFLDGAAGFTVCRISAYATWQKYKKLRDLNRSGKKSGS